MTIILHYYPGQFHKPSNTLKSGVYVNGNTEITIADDTTVGGGLLVVLKDGKEIYKAEAWGGPSKKIAIKGSMPQLPTPAGKYVIGPIMRYHTPSWGYSKIKWGTPLKNSPLEKNLPEYKKRDVWYQLPNGKWASVLKDTGISRADLKNRYRYLYGVNILPKTWVFNDFGPLAIRYFIDLNNNKKLDKNEKLEGTMFHTTPEDEAQTKRGKAVSLVESHGCIHLKPADRPKLIDLGAFKEGTDLIIHPYYKKYKISP